MKKKRANIWAKVLITLSVIIAIFAGGFFFLDKVIVPKYFATYGINGMGDLVGVVASLYKSPKESSLVKNPYTNEDFSSAISKLEASGYDIIDKDGTIKVGENESFEDYKGDKPVKFTDCEFAALCDKLLQNGALEKYLPNLNYLNVINISVRELIITPDKTKKSDDGYLAANIKFIVKIDSKDIREQIAKQMNTPIFLLNMIIPDVLYFSVSYDIDLSTDGERANGTIAITGRTKEQSEILINLLIEFIFPKEEQMDANGFINALGDIMTKGIAFFGDFKFVDDAGTFSNNNGLLITP